MIKKAIFNAIGAGLFGFALGLLLCFYDQGGRIYFAIDFIPNAAIFGALFGFAALLAFFWEK